MRNVTYVSYNLFKIMREKKLSYITLEELGVNRSITHRALTRPWALQLRTVAKIARALGVNVSDLLTSPEERACLEQKHYAATRHYRGLAWGFAVLNLALIGYIFLQ